MIILVASAVGLVLLVISGRTWVDFSQRADQLKHTIAEYERLIQEHQAKLEEARVRHRELKEQTEVAVEECDGADLEAQERRDELAQLEERLERVKPRHRRVDLNEDSGGSLWKAR